MEAILILAVAVPMEAILMKGRPNSPRAHDWLHRAPRRLTDSFSDSNVPAIYLIIAPSRRHLPPVLTAPDLLYTPRILTDVSPLTTPNSNST
jgi:hypothetical protein